MVSRRSPRVTTYEEARLRAVRVHAVCQCPSRRGALYRVGSKGGGGKAEWAAALAKALKTCRWVGLKGELQDMEAQVETVFRTGLAAMAAAGIVVTMSGFCAGASG